MGTTNRIAAAVSDVAVAALTAPEGVAQMMSSVLESVRVTMRADAAGFYEHQVDGFSLPLFLSPADVWQRIPFGRAPTAVMASAHPGIMYLLTNRPTKPYALTDVVSERAWWNSELGTRMRPDWGRNYQFAVPVPMTVRERTCWVWVLGRTSRDFSAADRDTASALQPILAVIARQHALSAARPRSAGRVTGVLTERELVVMELLAEGVTSRVAGHLLGISPRTAQKHVERIYRKLSVTNRYQAIEVARAHSIL